MKVLLTFLFCICNFLIAKGQEDIIAYKLTRENGLPDNSVRYIKQTSTGELLLMMPYDAYAYDGYSYKKLSDEAYKRLKDESLKSHSLKNGKGYDNLGNEVSIQGNVLLYIDKLSKEEIKLDIFDQKWNKLTDNLKCRVITDFDNNIWISFNGLGLFVYNKQTKQLQHITKNDGKGLLSTNYIVFMTIDRDGNIWLSEDHYGVACLKYTTKNYEIKRPFSVSDEEKSSEIRVLSKLPNGDVIIANNAGEVILADSFLHNKKSISTNGENILSASMDTLGRLWLGSKINGIYIDGKHYGAGRTDCILRDFKGRMWSCSLHGALTYYKRNVNQEIECLSFFSEIENLRPHVMIEDYRGYIWLGTERGLYVFNPDELIRNHKAYNMVSEEDVRSIFEDSQSRLWFGTAHNGVMHVKNTSDTFLSFTYINRVNGIVNEKIQSIVEDAEHNLYFATIAGCTKYNPEKEMLSNFYIFDYPKINYYEENSVVVMGNGRIALGSLDGIVILGPKNFSLQQSPNRLKLTDILVNGSSICESQDYLFGTNEQIVYSNIKLSHSQNSLTFYFSNFNYTNHQQTIYSYFLEGYDKVWSESSQLNMATYRNLLPGEYTFHYKYKEASGDWQDCLEPTRIRILPPIWATWWAKLLYFVLVMGGIGLILSQVRRMEHLKRKVAIEHGITEYKLRFFTNISHEFRTPLTLIQNSMEKIGDIKDVPVNLRQPINNMQRNVERMLRLINQLMEFRKMQNNKLILSVQETEIVEFLRLIYMNFYDIADNREITYRFIPSRKTLNIYIDRGYIDKIVYNLLSNAFKYTPQGGKVYLRLKVDKESVFITVEDTGIGITKENQADLFKRYSSNRMKADSVGIGLNLTQELVKVHHGTISYQQNFPQGSIFQVELPLTKESYKENEFLRTDILLDRNDTEIIQNSNNYYMESIPLSMNDCSILIVEDDMDVLNMLNRELSKFFRVIIANNGTEALERLKDTSNEIKLIVSDVMMPCMDGFELLQTIRADNRLCHLPIILLTALDGDTGLVKGLDMGADAYISKPFNLNLLISQSFNLINQRNVLKTVYSQESSQISPLPVIIREEKDLQFLTQLNALILRRMSDTSFSIDTMAESFGYGRTTFYNKVRQITGVTPNEYLRNARLKKAAEILRKEHVTIAETCFRVGIGNPQYFATSFKKKFGITPKEYQSGETIGQK